MNLHWLDGFAADTLLWDVQPAATEYHVYRTDVRAVTYGKYAACADGLDPDRTDTQLVDTDVPAGPGIFTYLMTAEDLGGNEGTLGYARGLQLPQGPAGGSRWPRSSTNVRPSS